MILLKFLALVGLITIFFCCALVFAALMHVASEWRSEQEQEEDDEEQAEYLRKWRKEHEEH